MIYQVILETKYPDYIDQFILVEVETLEQAEAVVSFMREGRPRLVSQRGQMNRLSIVEAIKVWSEDNFKVVS